MKKKAKPVKKKLKVEPNNPPPHEIADALAKRVADAPFSVEERKRMMLTIDKLNDALLHNERETINTLFKIFQREWSGLADAPHKRKQK